MLRSCFLVGHIQPSRPIQPEMGFCVICDRTVVLNNVRSWPEPYDIRTGECHKCGNTMTPYPSMPSGPPGAAA